MKMTIPNTPAEAYPVMLEQDGDTSVFVFPDFGGERFSGDVREAFGFLASLLRARKDAGHLFPYASSHESLTRMYPGVHVVMLSTDGWERLGSMEPAIPADD